jgi:Flp pilus assembly protein TadB
MIPEDAVSRAEIEAILFRIRQAKSDLIRVERDSGGNLSSVIRKLDEVVRKLTSA